MEGDAQLVVLAQQPPLSAKLARALGIHRLAATRRFLPPHVRGLPSGPASVASGVITGTEQLGLSFATEIPDAGFVDACVVLSGQGQASRACTAKASGRIGRLGLGPNLAYLPSSMRAIPWGAADVIVVPSQWVAALWAEDAPELADRIRLWPAGIDTGWWAPALEPGGGVLIYDKRLDGTAARLAGAISGTGRPARIITYGCYTPCQYRDALHASRVMIWVGRSESQGMAMFEAWSCNVPTIVLDDGVERPFGSAAEPAPFLTADRGHLASSPAEAIDLAVRVEDEGPFRARSSVEHTFGLAARAGALWNLLLPDFER